jgi:hypothetical protein
MKKQLLLLLVSLIGTVACKKSSSDLSPSFSTILTKHSWVHNGYIAIVDGKTYIGQNTPNYSVGPNPSTVFTFKSDGTYVISGDDSDQGKWTLTNYELIMINSSAKKTVYTLSNTSTTGFTMSYPEIDVTAVKPDLDLLFNEVFLASIVFSSIGLELPQAIRMVQIQLNLVAQ